MLKMLFYLWFFAFTGQQEVVTQPVPTGLHVVQSASDDSCFDYSLKYLNGQPFELPATIRSELYCSPVVQLSPDETLLLFVNPQWQLQLYDLANDTLTELLAFPQTTEGLNCQFSPSASHVACVAVNQQLYETLTEISILTLENGKLSDTQVFQRTVDFSCGSTCDPVFTFENDRTLQYYGHNALEDPQQSYRLTF